MFRNGVTHLWDDLISSLSALDLTATTHPVTGQMMRPFDRPVGETPGLITAVLWAGLMIAGLVFAIREYRWKAWPAVFLGVLSYGMLVPVFYSVRFSLPMLPFYAALVGVAVQSGGKLLARLFPRTDDRASVKGAAFAMAVAGVLTAFGFSAAYMGDG